jgi:hypothetical protein
VAEKKPFLLRVDRELLDAVQRWANDDLRSLNGHIEFLLRDALKRAGRLPKSSAAAPDAPAGQSNPEGDA